MFLTLQEIVVYIILKLGFRVEKWAYYLLQYIYFPCTKFTSIITKEEENSVFLFGFLFFEISRQGNNSIKAPHYTIDGDRDAGPSLGGRLGITTAQAAGFIHVKPNGISPSSFPNDDRFFQDSGLNVRKALWKLEVCRQACLWSLKQPVSV